jgi:DNA-directed RNA polymerase specialized sigma24 family protein
MVADTDGPKHVLGQWCAGRANARDLYEVVRAAMDQAARRAIWQMIGERPDPHEVQTAVQNAFQELWAKDPAAIDHLLGLAATIADRRGRDRGRAIIARQKKTRKLTDKLGDQLGEQFQFAELDAEAVQRRAEQLESTKECLEALPVEQRLVIEQTLLEGMNLSDWAHEHGKSHQAASAQRQRAIEAVKRCVEGKKRERDKQEGGPR